MHYPKFFIDFFFITFEKVDSLTDFGIYKNHVFNLTEVTGNKIIIASSGPHILRKSFILHL